MNGSLFKLNGGALPKRIYHIKLNGSQIEGFIVNWMAYRYFQTELQVTKVNGSQLDGPPRIEFWTTLKEPGID